MIGLRISRSGGHLIVEQRYRFRFSALPFWTLYAVDGERVE